MRTQKLGSQGPEMTVIGFGAWEAGGGSEWGQAPPDEQVVDAIRAALDSGIGWIDTAEVYGNGRSENVVGAAIAGRREETLVATKVAPGPEGTGFAPDQVRRACDQSLRRLRTDRIDLYQLHWPDGSGIPVEETWGAMTELTEAGKVLALGASNFDRELSERCEAVRHVDSLQQELSMLRPEERDLIRWCGEQGIGVVTYGPLAYGLLTGAITAETTFDATDFRGGHEAWDTYTAMFAPGAIDRSLAVVEALRSIAERLDATVAQVALAWNWHQPGVTSAIAGSRDPHHVRQNAAAADLVLDQGTLAELDDILQRGPAFAG
jgi:aryl-alcohol dehydrogenase-like predicted oxidoreductase